MELQAVVYDAAYSSVVGDGAVFVESFRRDRQLDGLSQMSISIPGTDTRALAAITARRVIEVWLYPNVGDDFSARLLGAFVVLDRRVVDAPAGLSLRVSGNEVMQKLKDTITLPNLIYDNATLTTIFDDLTALAGWTDNCEAGLGSLNWSGRFDGESVLKAMQTVSEEMGVHFRASSSVASQVDFGEFGTHNGLTAEYIEGETDAGIYIADAPLIIERIELLEESTDIVNAIYPYGSGNGDGALTLADSTRAGISSTSENGRTHYSVEDATSIAAYGRVEKRVNFKRVGLTGRSTGTTTIATQKERAANRLFDAADTMLDRYKDPYTSYKVTVRNAEHAAVKTGDKIHLLYKGWVVRPDASGDVRYQYADVDDLFYVMQATESVSLSGLRLDLVLASVDRQPMDVADSIVRTMDDVSVNQVGMNTNLNHYIVGPYNRFATTGDDAEFKFTVRARTLKITDFQLTIRRFAVVEHDHQVAQVQDTSVVGPETLTPEIGVFTDGASTHKVGWLTDAPAATVFRTSGGSDAYGNAISVLPEDFTIKLNGVTKASGVFPALSSDTEYVIDLTSDVDALGVGEHTITVECGTNFGWVQAEMVVEDEILNVRTQ